MGLRRAIEPWRGKAGAHRRASLEQCAEQPAIDDVPGPGRRVEAVNMDDCVGILGGYVGAPPSFDTPPSGLREIQERGETPEVWSSSIRGPGDARELPGSSVD